MKNNMENKVNSIHEARAIFDLLGIKDVTKDWQSKKGTQVFELPFKSAYYNGITEVNRFSVYRSGYVRKMVVNKNGASYSCWQLNKQYKSKRKYFNSYYKEYRTFDTTKRAMIYNEDDRIVYLCNYILRNYYNTDKWSIVGDYTKKLMSKYSSYYHENQDHQLPFVDKAIDRILENNIDDIKVIINGHRYNLS